MVRRREVDLSPGLLLEALVAMELGAVIHSDGTHAVACLTDQLGCPAIEGLRSTPVEFTDHGVAGLATDEGECAVTIEGADDGIALKVSHAGAVLSRSEEHTSELQSRE